MIQQAIDALKEARQDVECWAGFATPEIQKQYDLPSHLARIDADIEALEKFLYQEITTMAD
jgi:hypothetical protein